MSLKEDFAKKLTEAKAAAERGDVASAKSLREEAQNIKSAMQEFAELEKMGDEVKGTETIQRPPLSGVPAKDNSFVQAQNPAPDVAENPAIKAAYVMKFGDTDDAVKSILKNIHGNDYGDLYWMQKQAFNKYLRRGPGDLTGEEYKILKQVVWTPATIKQALAQGYTDFSYLKTTMVESSDVLGGFVVPVDINMNVIERLQGATVMRGRARQINTSRDRVEMPKATGGDSQYKSNVRVTWVTETPAAGASATNLTWGQEAIPVHTVMATTAISRNLLEDAAFNLEQYLSENFAASLAIAEDNVFLTGTGNGQPQGILPSKANGLGLTPVKSGSTTALDWEKLQQVAFKLDAQYRKNAVWIMNKNTVLAILQLKNATSGDYLWQPYQFMGAQDNRPPMLFGYPVLEQEVMDDIGSGKYPILFGDLSGYLIVDRVGMTVERYLDASTAETNTVKFIMRRRVGGQALETYKFIAHQTAV